MVDRARRHVRAKKTDVRPVDLAIVTKRPCDAMRRWLTYEGQPISWVNAFEIDIIKDSSPREIVACVHTIVVTRSSRETIAFMHYSQFVVPARQRAPALEWTARQAIH